MAQICIESFADVNDRTVVKQGVALPDNHPLVQRYPNQFMDADAREMPHVETTTQAPGQGRALSRASQAARQTARDKAKRKKDNEDKGTEAVTVIQDDQA
jgi:hypothetical protein